MDEKWLGKIINMNQKGICNLKLDTDQKGLGTNDKYGLKGLQINMDDQKGWEPIFNMVQKGLGNYKLNMNKKRLGYLKMNMDKKGLGHLKLNTDWKGLGFLTGRWLYISNGTQPQWGGGGGLHWSPLYCAGDGRLPV